LLKSIGPVRRRSGPVTSRWAGIVIGLICASAFGQAAPDPDAPFRREREREAQRRELLERDPNVRLAPSAPSPDRLPDGESPCTLVAAVRVEGLAAIEREGAWAAEQLAGPDGMDAPASRCLGTDGIAVLVRRLQNALLAEGFATTRVVVPEQDLRAGELRLLIIPGRVRAVRTDAPPAGVQPPLRAGQVLNLRAIEQALETLQRVPTAQAIIHIEPAEPVEPGAGWSDVVIDWRQPRKWRLTATLDDSGTRSTGRLQASATLSLDNVFGLNELVYVTRSGSAGDGEEGNRGNAAQVLHVSVPAGWWLLGLTASRSRFHQSVAGLSQTYLYRGTSDNVDARATRLLHRDANGRTTATVGAFARSSRNFIDDTEVEVQRRRVGGWELGMAHRRSLGDATAEGSLVWRHGTGAFGSLPAPEQAFGEGTSRFSLFVAEAGLASPWRLGGTAGAASLRWRAQWNRTPLTPQDRFSIGGRHTVRGFSGEQVLVAERGRVLRAELSLSLPHGVQPFAAIDHGEVGGPSAELLAGRRLTGLALGLRGAVAGLRYEVFVGTPVSKPDALHVPHTTGGFSLVWSY
jgi:hemolysin activation/secretion protein